MVFCSFPFQMKTKQNAVSQDPKPQPSAAPNIKVSPAEDYSYDEYEKYEDMPNQIESYYVGENGR